MTKYENGSTVCVQFGFIKFFPNFIVIFIFYLRIYLLNLKCILSVNFKFNEVWKIVSHSTRDKKKPAILDFRHILDSFREIRKEEDNNTKLEKRECYRIELEHKIALLD